MVKLSGNNTFLDDSKLVRMVILSGFVHFLAFFLFVFLPNIFSPPSIRIIPQYTPVALVGPGELGGGGGGAASKPVTVPKQRVNVAAKQPELIQKKVETKPIEIAKTQAKIKPEPVPKTASPAKEEKNNSPSQEANLNQALENIRERVAAGGGQAGDSGGVGGVGVGVTPGGGGNGGPEMEVYMSIVVDRIMEAWFCPPNLQEQAIRQGLVTQINIRIDRDGKVAFQGFDKKSGNAAYDDSAQKAIQQVQLTSFPPLPEVYRGRFFDMGILFQKK